MKLTNKMSLKSTLALALITTMSASLSLHAVDQQTVKTKDFYINRIATNSKDSLNLERIIAAGLTLRTLSFAGGILTTGGIVLGDLIIALGTLAYGPEMLATYVAVEQLKKAITKEPELSNVMTKNDHKIFNAGKAVLKGPILNYISQAKTIKTEIKKTAQTFISSHPDLIKTIPQKNLEKTLSNYLTTAVSIKTYNETQQKKIEFQKNIKAGILTPVIQSALNFIDKFISEPNLKKSIDLRKKSLIDILYRQYPALGTLETSLQKTTDELFIKIKNLKKQYERNGKDLVK